jgi:hypothetical protein
MLSSGQQAASFIPILYDTLQANNLSVALTCCDNEGWPDTVTTTSQLVSAGMESYLSVITSHAYTGDPNSVVPTNLTIWETEAADLNDAWCTTWYSNGGQCEGMTWANKIATGILNANLSAYLYWEGVEVNEQQASSYLVLSDGTTATPSGHSPWCISRLHHWNSLKCGDRRIQEHRRQHCISFDELWRFFSGSQNIAQRISAFDCERVSDRQ